MDNQPITIQIQLEPEDWALEEGCLAQCYEAMEDAVSIMEQFGFVRRQLCVGLNVKEPE